MKTTSRTKQAIAAGALVLVGFGGGATAMLMSSASADGTANDSRDAGNGEKPLTGSTLAKVTAAVEAKYPGATIDRAETDSDGVYEAHITTADGDELIVQVGKDFAVTGTQTGRGHHGGPDGDGGHGHGGRGEEALTGTTLTKVTAAVEAKYPGATIERAETDSDGVYEAHITTADGDKLTVEVGKDFAVTGTESH